MNTERQRLRNAFRLIEDNDENCHLKDYLISISTQKTQYQNLNAQTLREEEHKIK